VILNSSDQVAPEAAVYKIMNKTFATCEHRYKVPMYEKYYINTTFNAKLSYPLFENDEISKILFYISFCLFVKLSFSSLCIITDIWILPFLQAIIIEFDTDMFQQIYRDRIRQYVFFSDSISFTN